MCACESLVCWCLCFVYHWIRCLVLDQQEQRLLEFLSAALSLHGLLWTRPAAGWYRHGIHTTRLFENVSAHWVDRKQYSRQVIQSHDHRSAATRPPSRTVLVSGLQNDDSVGPGWDWTLTSMFRFELCEQVLTTRAVSQIIKLLDYNLDNCWRFLCCLHNSFCWFWDEWFRECCL